MRTITLQRAAAMLIALVALAACDAETTAPQADTMRASAVSSSASSVYRTSGSLPTSFVIYASCANAGQGEVLQVNGQVEYTGQWVTTTQGQRVHHVLKTSFTGSGIGWDTGEAYDVVTRESSQGMTAYGNDGIADSGEQLQRMQVELTSKASGAVIKIVLTARFVQAATGQIVVDIWDAATRCS